jgi:hypothetical protein
VSRRKRKLALTTADMSVEQLERIATATMDAKYTHLDALMDDPSGPAQRRKTL